MKTLVALTLAAASMAASANVVTFDGNQMNLVGASSTVGTSIQLVSKGANAGAAWLTTPVSTVESFDVNFAFSLRSEGGGLMADGISFALQDKGTNVLGYAGGNVGYTHLNAVGSIIQTYYNNTAGLNIDGNAYNTKSANLNLGGASLVTGTEVVTYDAMTHMLHMTGTLNVDGSLHNISDSKVINLEAKFGDTVFMGFTGATGDNYADERITSFSVQSTPAVPEPETYAMLLTGLASMGFVARRRKSL